MFIVLKLLKCHAGAELSPLTFLFHILQNGIFSAALASLPSDTGRQKIRVLHENVLRGAKQALVILFLLKSPSCRGYFQ